MDFDALPPMPVYDGRVPLPVWPHPVQDGKDDVSPFPRTDSLCTAYAWPQAYTVEVTASNGASSSTDPYAVACLKGKQICRTESEGSSLLHYENGQKKRWTDLPQDPESTADDAESLLADSLGMISELLPQKNTFVHFEDDELPTLYPHRSLTCPETRICPPQIPEGDLSEDECTAAKASPVERTKRWADLSEDEQTPAHQKVHQPQRWADLSEDEQSPEDEQSQVSETLKVKNECADLPEAEEITADREMQGKKRWADISEDEQTPSHQGNSSLSDAGEIAANQKVLPEELEEEQSPGPQRSSLDDHSMDLPDSKKSSEGTGSTSASSLREDAKHQVAQPQQPSRPKFARPTREARIRQFQAKLDELFSLSFDEVDPSQQDGLTHRMLVGLKSLAEMVNFWQPDGTQVSEEGFKLVGLEEGDMYALGRIIRKADKLLEGRQFRDAYDKLRTAHRWFDPVTVLEERAKAAKKAKKEKTEGKEKILKSTCHSDVDDDNDDWTQVKKKDKKKAKEELPTVERPRSKNSLQNRSSKDHFSTPNPPQSSGPRLQTSGLKGQSSQGRKGPQKLLCRYNVGIEQNRAFNVVQKLLGDRGSHMKSIAENTGSKLRIRGRGSGFLEGPDQKEASNEPLMLCISASTREGFDNAVQDVESLLEYVHDQYRTFCQDRNLPVPRLSIVQNEQPALH